MTGLAMALEHTATCSSALFSALAGWGLGLWAVAAFVGEPADDELVRRTQAGDTAAFAALVRRHQDRIYTVCLRWLREPALAEEIAQDVFVAAFRSIGGFRGEARFSTWLVRIAVNRCKNKRVYNLRRAHDRHEPLEGLGGDGGPVRQLADPGARTDAALHRTEAAQLVLGALDGLDEGHRAVVVLRDLEDLNYDEIADMLGIPVGTVKSRLHRARHQLARALGHRVDPSDL